jgi:L-rhamnose mutarotase
MKRLAFVMKLKAGFEEEYRKRHDALWPEMKKALKDAGISDYSIFLDPATLLVFAVQKRTDDSTADDLPNHPAVRRWWRHMAEIMETNPDSSPAGCPSGGSLRPFPTSPEARWDWSAPSIPGRPSLP